MAGPRFYPDDPIWVEPVTQDVTSAARYEPDLVYQTLENLFSRPGDPVLGMAGERANPETLARIRSELGQDRPLSLQ